MDVLRSEGDAMAAKLAASTSLRNMQKARDALVLIGE
jgi:hypothetical protein